MYKTDHTNMNETWTRVWRPRLLASGVHLGVSLAIAALAGLLVFGLWHPYPYREISGGRELFTLVVSVDVVLGPMITLAIFNLKKGWPVLRRDLAVIALLQVLALAYGLWTVFVARPAHLVYEYNRFRVVHAIDVPSDQLDKAPQALRKLPLWGPTPLSLRPFRDNDEKANATLADIAGVPLASQPALWQSYESGLAELRQEAKPVARLKARFAASAPEIDQLLRSVGRQPDDVAWVPMIGRKTFWTVFVDTKTGQLLAFMPLDSF